MRTFTVLREGDESGVSGTGTVAEGVEFGDGTCVIRWMPAGSPGRSTVVWDNFGAFVMVHIAPHESNKTKVIFSDGTVYEHTSKVEEADQPPSKPPTKTKRARKKKILVETT